MTDAPVPSGGLPPAGERAETELLERLRDGDADAFDTLVTRHSERAFRIAYRLLGHREDAEDLVQEAFMTVLEKIETFDAQRPFLPWFNRILVNRGLNSRKARAVRQTEPLAADVAASSASPARQTEQAQVAARVRAALANLPDRQKVIVELFELEGFSGAEIAEILDISAGTVRWHLHEARRALREVLAPLQR